MKIRPLSRTDEKRLLVSILCQLNEAPANGLLARIARELVMFALAFSVLFVGLVAYFGPTPFGLLLMGGSLILGLGIGLAAWRYTAATQWTALARCIDREKVETRLRELDA